MSYSDALNLTTSGDNWDSLTSSGVTPLGFTFYSTVNPFPNYYYSDAPTDTVWSSDYTDIVSTGNEDFVQTAQKSLIRHDLSDTTGIDYRVSFSDVSNLTFSEQNSPSAVGQIFIANANITDTHTFGQTFYPESANGYSTFAGDVFLDNDNAADPNGFIHEDVMQSQLGIGQMGAYITLHELGHAVGLLHPTDTALNGTIFDNQKYTIMTDDPTKTDSDMDKSVFPTGLQLLDIAVLQSMYGVNWGGIRGDGGAHENTVYSKDGAFATANAHDAFIYTIWDGAGTDVIDASGYSTPAQIDLRQGHFSSIGVQGDSGDTPVAFDSGGVDHGNLAIAYFAIIENAIGTGHDDTLIGNAWNNVLSGGAGNDTIYGDGIAYDGDAGAHDPNTNKDASGNVLDWGPDAVPYASNLSGDDILIGGAGNDYFYGGLGNDVIHGGYVASDITDVVSGWDPAGEFTGTNNANGIAYSDITVASDGNDTADYSNLSLGTSHTGISVTFSDSVDYGTVSKGASGALGTDKLFSIENVVGTAQNDTFTGAPNDVAATFKGGAGSDSYNLSAGFYGNVTIVEPAAKGLDTLVLDNSATADFGSFSDSSGHIHIAVGITGGLYNGGEVDFDTSTLGDGYGVENIQLGSDLIRATDLYNWLTDTTDSVSDVDLLYLEWDVNSLSSTGWNGGTGGSGAGGGTLPIYTGGILTGMEISPAIGGSPISFGIADVIDNPMVLTSFSESYSGGTYTSTAGWQTYEQAFDFAGGTTASDVRLTLGGSEGAGALTIHIDSLDFSLTIGSFETGQTINGIEVYNSTLHGIIQDASGATLVSTGTNTFGGSYLTPTGMSVDTSAHVTVTYYLESLGFATGGGIDLTAPITFTGSDSGETLTGLDARADTIYGMGGNDNIYGYGGDDTLIGGLGNDQLYGGTGNDTYLFASGWGADTVHENLSEGTDTIHFTGIAPSDIRMYTDSSGYLHLVQISDPSNNITVNAGYTGSGTAESKIGLYVESVTFDSSYATTWDLTGGLNLAGDNSGDYLYGTAYGDTITGGTGADHIYGNGGNDTLISGAGADILYGGTGDDTYVFSPGFGNAVIHENLSEGTDTIHFTGIAPSDIRMYTDSSGYLHLVQISNPTNNITVNAGYTGSGTAESKIGLYVESVTFDSSYATTWDLTGGLNLGGDNSGDYLYGTAYGDTITGGTGIDHIYGNGGNDTLISGAGADILYGGTGDDTYVFSSGFGNAVIHENLSEGTDTIHFTGIAPSDIRMYTDGSGYLHLVQISNPTNNITVNAGYTGSGTAESKIGLYVESVTFDSSYATTWDLTGGLNLRGDNSGDYLYGTAYGDTITGGTGIDHIYGNGGNDTLISGAGADILYGGTGNDTYVFSSGFGNAVIHENTGEGTDTIHFSGIDPADIRMYTDSAGYLHLQDTTDPSYNITVTAGVTGSNTSESTIGSYVESVTFDSVYGTTWDLTGGLNLTGNNSGGYIYGTAYGDTITGGTGVDNLYGNAGNDTLIGGAGADNLYGGPGNDTYVFSSGFGNVAVHESLSSGTDTIHFTGIDPANIRMWTDSSGYLHLQNSSDTSHSITVYAGTTGSGTAESAIGSYVESVTFDSVYGTTWDLTGGLPITGDNSGDYLYGTPYGDTITGGSSADHIYGNGGDDVLYGAGGADTLTGGAGADTFLFKAATAMGASDTIADFTTAQGDKIDIANVISTYDPLTMAIANFVQLATSGSDTQVKVDTDGSGTSYTQIATIHGVTGLNLNDLITDGNLVVHHTSNRRGSMAKAGTRKKKRVIVDTFADLLKENKPYTGDSTLFSDPSFRASEMELPPVRKRSRMVITTRTFIEMPDGSLIMQVSRHTEPAPKGNAAGIDPADIRMYTDRSGRLRVGVRSRPAGKRVTRKKPARTSPPSAHVKPRSSRA